MFPTKGNIILTDIHMLIAASMCESLMPGTLVGDDPVQKIDVRHFVGNLHATLYFQAESPSPLNPKPKDRVAEQHARGSKSRMIAPPGLAWWSRSMVWGCNRCFLKGLVWGS